MDIITDPSTANTEVFRSKSRLIAIIATAIAVLCALAFGAIALMPTISEQILSETSSEQGAAQSEQAIPGVSPMDAAKKSQHSSVPEREQAADAVALEGQAAGGAAVAAQEDAERAKQIAREQSQAVRQAMDATPEERARLEASAQQERQSAMAAQTPGTLLMFGKEVPYIYSYNVVSAPNKGCGIWKGVDDVNDGEYTYFVGHNPGDFSDVMNLAIGSKVSLKGADGQVREYTVGDVFTIAQRTTFQDIRSRVEGHGESIVMQTCCGDNVNVRVVVAW